MMPAQAAYVHIPFCRRRCFYCDFPVSVVGDRRDGENSQTIARYVELLGEEIALQFKDEMLTVQASHPQTSLTSIFFGGGTPSLLTPGQVVAVLEQLARWFGIAVGAEISMEMDPGTFDLGRIQGYLAAGVTRVSLGAQAFQDELLGACGRTHRVAEIDESLKLLQRAGCENFSLDLISGLPGQTLTDWQASLQAAIALGPQHLSCYDLIVEPGTVFAKRYAPGEQPLPPEDLAAQMYRMAQETLTAAGYDHYEISNYARPGYTCRHNRVYWANQAYYGFGMGAASYLGGRRFTRPRTQQAYRAWVEAWRAGRWHWREVPGLTAEDELLETLMLGLRLAEGVSAAAIAAQFGEDTWRSLLRTVAVAQSQGWVAVESQSTGDQRLKLTDPEGFLVSNSVLADVFNGLTRKRG